MTLEGFSSLNDSRIPFQKGTNAAGGLPRVTDHSPGDTPGTLPGSSALKKGDFGTLRKDFCWGNLLVWGLGADGGCRDEGDATPRGSQQEANTEERRVVKS